MKVGIILVFILMSIKSFSQNTFLLKGVVKGPNGGALAGASVFISGTKMASSSDNIGAFYFNLSPGSYELIVKSIGYKTKSQMIEVKDQPVLVSLTLAEQMIDLLEVKINADPNRSTYFKNFFDLFIGKSLNAKYCKILNPEVLNILYEKNTGVLNVNNTDFLLIENKALGYRLKYLLESFVFDEKENQMSYGGSVYFEDLEGTAKERLKWLENRETAYKGSPQHFFTALYHGNLTAEGFQIANLANKVNLVRPADSLIKAKIKSLMVQQKEADGLVISKSDSLSYWLKMKNLPAFLPELEKRNILEDTLLHKANYQLGEIKSKKLIYVIYQDAKEEPGFISSLNQVKRILDVRSAQVSQIKIISSSCLFSENGKLLDPKSIYYTGYWGWKNVADALPFDYVPEKRKP